MKFLQFSGLAQVFWIAALVCILFSALGDVIIPGSSGVGLVLVAIVLFIAAVVTRKMQKNG